MRRKTRLYPEEQFERLRRNFSLTARPDNGQDALETAFRARHPTRAATRKQAELRAAGRFVAFQRLGMWATFAITRGSADGHRGWDGRAYALYRAAPQQGRKVSPHATFRAEAIAALCAPVAEELWGSHDLLNSVSLLVAGASYARCAAELEGRDEDAVAREVVTSASSLAERHGDDIWAIADMLERFPAGLNRPVFPTPWKSDS